MSKYIFNPKLTNSLLLLKSKTKNNDYLNHLEKVSKRYKSFVDSGLAKPTKQNSILNYSPFFLFGEDNK